LALLAYWKDQQRMSIECENRARAQSQRMAVEQSRQAVDRRAQSAAMARYESEATGRRAVFEAEQAERQAKADAQIAELRRSLDQSRRVAEENARRSVSELLAKSQQEFRVEQDVEQRTTVAAMNAEKTYDAKNVAESRAMVRTKYGASPVRETRWIRDSAWSAAAREVRERNTVKMMTARHETAEAAFVAGSSRKAQAELQGWLTELRRRDEATVSAMIASANREALLQANQFAMSESAKRSLVVAAIEEAAQLRAEQWARLDAIGGSERIASGPGSQRDSQDYDEGGFSLHAASYLTAVSQTADLAEQHWQSGAIALLAFGLVGALARRGRPAMG
jgi:hypothetical protein